MQIAAAGYKLRWYNQPIYICEYLNDGLTNTGANSVIGHKKNYKGYCLYVRKCIELKPFIQKMAHLREFNKTMKVLKVPFEKEKKRYSNVENMLFSIINIWSFSSIFN